MASAEDDVQLPDLQVIQRYSLAVRGATAPRADVVAALEADLAWLTGGARRRPAATRSTRAVPEPAAPAPVAAKPAAPKAVAKNAPAKQAPGKKAVAKKAAAKKTVAKKAPAKKAARRR